MMSRIPILLDEKAAAGLVALAKQEYRDPRQQAAVIIRQELERLGLLSNDPRAGQQKLEPVEAQNGNPG